MTEPVETAAESPAEPQTQPPKGEGMETPAAETVPSEAEPPKSREAKQRIELRETKARLERMQRTEIERIAASRLSDPTDLWVGGVTVDAVLDESGDVDSAKVDEAVGQLLREHPHWAPTKPAPPKRGWQSGLGTTPGPARSWATALRPDRG